MLHRILWYVKHSGGFAAVHLLAMSVNRAPYIYSLGVESWWYLSRKRYLIEQIKNSLTDFGEQWIVPYTGLGNIFRMAAMQGLIFGVIK